MRIFLHSAFDTISGYGNTATNLAVELEKCGVDVYPICKGIGFEMPDEFTNLFLKKNPQGLYFDYYINFDVPKNLDVATNFGICNKKIAYTMWEQTKLTNDFKKNNFNKFDYLVVPCEMNIEPFSDFFKKNIYINPLGVDTKFYTPVNRILNDDSLKVCVNGAMTYRKGVDILIDVMLDERIKRLPIYFNIKNSQQTIHPAIIENNPNIKIYEGVWNKFGVRNFYELNDVMLALSRGEGYNQPAVEFLRTGGVVVTHNWGGHAVWANSEFCKLIPYKLVSVQNWDNVNKDSKWAEVNKEDVINALISLYENKSQLKTLSNNAVKFSESFSFEDMAANFINLLERIDYER